MEKELSLIKEVRGCIQSSAIPKESDSKQIEEIEMKIGRLIPNEIKKYLANIQNLPSDAWEIFLGYRPIPLDDLAAEYRDIRNSSFFGGFGIDDSFKSAEGSELRIFNSLVGEVEEDIVVNDLSRVIPLFSGGSCFYLALFYNEINETEIAIITQDSGISSLSPSIMAHLQNLEDGLKKGIYYIEDEDLTLPSTWYQRVQALTPEGLDVNEWNT